MFSSFNFARDKVYNLDRRFGYYWDPQIVAILTRFHVFFPVGEHLRFSFNIQGLTISSRLSAAFITLIAALSLIPVMCSRHLKMYPYPLFSLLSLLSFLTSLVALIFALVTWIIAKQRFNKENISASLGPLVSPHRHVQFRLVQGTFTNCIT